MFLNFIIFQSVWMISVIGQDDYLWVSILLLGLHFWLSQKPGSDLRLMLKIAAAGLVMDTALSASGVLIFNGELMPLWMFTLWCAFALTFNHSLEWMTRLRVRWLVLLGTTGGSSTYYAGAMLGAADLGYSLVFSGTVLVILWGAALPLFCYIKALNDRPSHVVQPNPADRL